MLGKTGKNISGPSATKTIRLQYVWAAASVERAYLRTSKQPRSVPRMLRRCQWHHKSCIRTLQLWAVVNWSSYDCRQLLKTRPDCCRLVGDENIAIWDHLNDLQYRLPHPKACFQHDHRTITICKIIQYPHLMHGSQWELFCIWDIGCGIQDTCVCGLGPSKSVVP